MMATTAVVGLNAGKRLLSSSFYYSDVTEKFLSVNDLCSSQYYYHIASTRSGITAKKTSSSSSSNYSPSFHSSSRHTQSAKALKESVDVVQQWLPPGSDQELEEDDDTVEALLLLQRSLLEKQWNLSFEKKKKIPVTCSGISARQRRMGAKKKTNIKVVNSDLFQNNRVKGGYVKGVISDDVLSHAEVVRLSKKIKSGLRLDEHKSRLKDRLGCEPSDEQLATSLKISRAELQAWLMECNLAREKLAMSNVRLVMSIAQRYDNMGAEMSDLVQGGLIGLLRGIEKFDSSKGFRISTYVYWWIRQGVSRALVDNSRTLRLPTHLHERLGLIRNAKLRLQEKGITPSIDRIAESLNMSQKKVRNATEAVSKIFSLDRDAFPSLNGLPGETHHSYIADNRLENNPWHGYDEWALKDEVRKLISATLGDREREIIRLYYGLDKECLTWEDISKRIGLSRERVRQVGLVALEKLKHAARKSKMEAMILKN
ncbi:hypothetical protein Bca4012_050799 [Brassica carinata]|uniref:RNA polymerase sigma-70 domain-containing protein n=2 Tax=Brassica TaxID=3705 RepID=A0A0D3AS29_BRAOL|nr:PREDICTED: RNA polymerase sigma factor sigA [Brassica oleracea var. oleracea]XP_013621484.1 PREDICTED: RNA polymerase sigma factor sigA [Brassica oleracea var. oleracea]XP_013621485.1 PREDICTED: RNA polymerase sigma factor sigA [Brassica oleracea var. oleracea]KAG2282280.1 hypothetical protein Bca52824_053500 [Brassica carinata]